MVNSFKIVGTAYCFNSYLGLANMAKVTPVTTVESVSWFYETGWRLLLVVLLGLFLLFVFFVVKHYWQKRKKLVSRLSLQFWWGYNNTMFRQLIPNLTEVKGCLRPRKLPKPKRLNLHLPILSRQSLDQRTSTVNKFL